MMGGYPNSVALAKRIGLTPDECRKIRFAYKAEPRRSAEEDKKRLPEIARREAEEAGRRRLAELATTKAERKRRAEEEKRRLAEIARREAEEVKVAQNPPNFDGYWRGVMECSDCRRSPCGGPFSRQTF